MNNIKYSYHRYIYIVSRESRKTLRHTNTDNEMDIYIELISDELEEGEKKTCTTRDKTEKS